MKVRNVHSRDIDAPPDRVGALIDGLGSDDDRLWPTDLWPSTPSELHRPLAVGTTGRQGQIRQAIEDYEPGRRLVFRFAPKLGLVATHGVELQALSSARTRLTHTLDCRVESKLLALYPILIRQHDALVEDIVERAELAATGTLAQVARWPASVRIANAIELRIGRWFGTLQETTPALAPHAGPRRDRFAQRGGVLIPATLSAIAAVHIAWALGWRRPAGSDRAFAEHVLSERARTRLGSGELPSEPTTLAVAIALLVAAAIVRSAATGSRSRMLRAAAWGVSAVLLHARAGLRPDGSRRRSRGYL